MEMKKEGREGRKGKKRRVKRKSCTHSVNYFLLLEAAFMALALKPWFLPDLSALL